MAEIQKLGVRGRVCVWGVSWRPRGPGQGLSGENWRGRKLGRLTEAQGVWWSQPWEPALISLGVRMGGGAEVGKVSCG